MQQDRDTGQSFLEPYAAVSDIDPQFLEQPDLTGQNGQINVANLRTAIRRTNDAPLTRELLVERHDLDPNDPETAKLLDRILDLRDRAKIKEHLSAIAANHIEKFKKARQNGNGTSPLQELQNP